MATVQDLKRRVRSVRNTRKITKAMELVASARLRRAQARIEAMRPYADRMLELMGGVARVSASPQRLPLLMRIDVKPVKGMPWPSLVVEPRRAPESACASYDPARNRCMGTG